ncbi:hypothetical protein Poli38472_007673 [Pythium oligandrum]|uniref:DNA endonuclease activator Ctp1 C-terminal domain-containing protein n=1 Tax=Pythium oligandrum TaxID=41045 RepID=A0A8K1CQK3_PYTOL|nr:hypothetical protein Poli38472_007673 [Pythium oligandrum]|eukprot:TMW68001.1 hypothetical protein Poli38472_007673 [Pythium oligandrum]
MVHAGRHGDGEEAVAPPHWQHERAQLLETIHKQQTDATRLAKRFKLLQQTLAEQQKVLDRYQKALYASGNVEQVDTIDEKRNEQDGNRSGLVSRPQKRVRLVDEARSEPTETKPRKPTKPTWAVTDNSRSKSETKDQDHDTWMSRRKDLHAEAKRGELDTRTRTPSLGVVEKLPEKRRVTPSPKQHVDGESSDSDGFLDDAVPVRSANPPVALAKPAHNRQRDFPLSRFTKRPSSEAVSLPARDEENKENAFAYVEVVRNRAERASLPGHDCLECRKYYQALDGLISAEEIENQMNKCSRHRARFEPYNTPDDFWRLSFPDSASVPPDHF